MKPILFNTEMVRAILDGRKTVTRRVVAPRHLDVLNSPYHREHPETPDQVLLEKLCEPPCRPGDVLWVRETWAGMFGKIVYRADYKEPVNTGFWRPSIHMPKRAARLFLCVTDVRVERLQSSFVEQGSTIFELRAEGVSLSEECRDCINTYGSPCCNDDADEGGSECGMLDDVRGDFADLWDSTLKPSQIETLGWAANPWIWRVEFERCGKPEEAGT